MSEKIQIKNIPDNLDPNMLEFANHICGTEIDTSNNKYPLTLRAEFIRWTDFPEGWAGAWSGTHVLALIEDHTDIDPPVKPSKILDDEVQQAARTSTYNLPHQFRKRYEKIVTENETKCFSTSLTNSDLTELEAILSDEEKSQWEKSIATWVASVRMDNKARPTVEKPIRIYLAGTDDTSYSLTCVTADEAFACLDRVKTEPTWELLKSESFVFSN